MLEAILGLYTTNSRRPAVFRLAARQKTPDYPTGVTGQRDQGRRAADEQARTRLGGCAIDQLFFSQLQEPADLLTRDGGVIFEKLLQRGVALDVVDQALDRNAGAFKARGAAHPLGIDPDDFAELCFLFGGHNFKVHDQRGAVRSRWRG